MMSFILVILVSVIVAGAYRMGLCYKHVINNSDIYEPMIMACEGSIINRIIVWTLLLLISLVSFPFGLVLILTNTKEEELDEDIDR